MNSIEKRDIQRCVSSFKLTDKLEGSTFLITGATGLIGSSLVHLLSALEKKVKIIAPVRNAERALSLFDDTELAHVSFIECDLLTYDYSRLGDIDYIIHCAAPTSSKFFVEKPVDTSEIIIDGTKALLNYAAKRKIRGFVYLSSLEVYGSILDDTKEISEDIQGYLDPMSVRSSYPMAKRAAENLCCLYAKQYNVPVKIARLTQTTGAGLSKDDNRVIAQFARLTAKGQDIVLHTSGESARPYCYITDALTAILYILLKGQPGDAYNVANEDTYISAKGMAEFLRDNFNPHINVKVELNGNMGYAPTTKLKLSAHKLRCLGWYPQIGLYDIFDNLIRVIQENEVSFT